MTIVASRCAVSLQLLMLRSICIYSSRSIQKFKQFLSADVLEVRRSIVSFRESPFSTGIDSQKHISNCTDIVQNSVFIKFMHFGSTDKNDVPSRNPLKVDLDALRKR